VPGEHDRFNAVLDRRPVRVCETEATAIYEQRDSRRILSI